MFLLSALNKFSSARSFRALQHLHEEAQFQCTPLRFSNISAFCFGDEIPSRYFDAIYFPRRRYDRADDQDNFFERQEAVNVVIQGFAQRL